MAKGKGKGKPRRVKMPWTPPTFGLDGIPSTYDNPYIAQPALHAAKPIDLRHESSLGGSRTRSRVTQGEEDGASSPFVFPLIIGSMLILAPLLLLAVLGMFVLDWRGGVQKGWSG